MKKRTKEDNHSRQNSKRVRGSVIVEAAIWIGFLAMAVPAIADIFFLSNTRMALGQITREAVMTQITYPNSVYRNIPSPNGIVSTISNNRNIQEQQLSNCITAVPDNNGGLTTSPQYISGFNEQCAHDFVKWRIIRLVESNKIRIKTDDIRVMTRIINGNMQVNVETTYDSLFAFFKGKKINSTATAQFLG